MKLENLGPYAAWQQMDNYLSAFVFENPHLEATVKHRIQHFRHQYLVKVSNIFPSDAAAFSQPISPWGSPYPGDYHRFYHYNPLLDAIGGEGEFLLSQANRCEGCQPISIGGEELFLVSKSNPTRAFIVEKGFTPTLQQAASALAHLGFSQPNPTYDFPKQHPAEASFSLFRRHPIFLQFHKLGENFFSALVLSKLLEIDLEREFERRGISSLLASSYGRILWFLEQSLLVDRSKYLNLPIFESFLELVHEEILLWLMLIEPYSPEDLSAAIQKTLVSPPAFLKTVSSGMIAFTEILEALLGVDQTVLIFEGIYFENRASLLKSHPLDRICLVSSPDYMTSLQDNLNRLKNHTIDLLFVDFHENLLKGRYVSKKNEIGKVIAQIFRSGKAASSLTVVIDQTIGFLDSAEIGSLLQQFRREIDAKKLHFVIVWSHQKFDLFGFDKVSAGSYCIYSRDDAFVNRFKPLNEGKIDFVSRQMLAHYFLSAPEQLEERRAKIFSNALYVNQNITRNQASPIQIALKHDPQNFSVDVHCPSDLDLPIRDLFIKQGIPLMIRGGFGYNLTTVAFTSFHTLRFSIGTEDRVFLDELIRVLSSIGSHLVV